MSRKKRSGKTRGPKGAPTPKNTPGEMTRSRHARLLARRGEHAIKKGDGIERMLKQVRGDGMMSEQDALEMLLREAGAIVLEAPEPAA